jgi:hypothetical protein
MGFSWYKRDEWSQLLDCSIDREILPDSFDKWEEDAIMRFHKLREMGVDVHKIYIDVSEFINWCEDVSFPINELARSLFLGIKAQQYLENYISHP